jgi:hypothetical protein
MDRAVACHGDLWPVLIEAVAERSDDVGEVTVGVAGAIIDVKDPAIQVDPDDMRGVVAIDRQMCGEGFRADRDTLGLRPVGGRAAQRALAIVDLVVAAEQRVGQV